MPDDRASSMRQRAERNLEALENLVRSWESVQPRNILARSKDVQTLLDELGEKVQSGRKASDELSELLAAAQKARGEINSKYEGDLRNATIASKEGVAATQKAIDDLKSQYKADLNAAVQLSRKEAFDEAKELLDKLRSKCKSGHTASDELSELLAAAQKARAELERQYEQDLKNSTQAARQAANSVKDAVVASVSGAVSPFERRFVNLSEGIQEIRLEFSPQIEGKVAKKTFLIASVGIVMVALGALVMALVALLK